MSITEAQRHQLFQRLEEVLGEEATVLMELLPPLGWADVARRHDVDRLGERMDRFDARMGRFESRMDAFEGRFERLHRDMRVQLYWLIGAMGTFTAILSRIG